MLWEIVIEGLVQGVGFRPFVYLLAKETGVKGNIANTNRGVVIRADFSDVEQASFIRRLRSECPPAACIRRIEASVLPDDGSVFSDFSIVPSILQSGEVTQVAPDIAVCDTCLKDRRRQPHRINYPFINCTRCGPRFTIIRDLPYDRPQTTMSHFEVCKDCRKEYMDVADRRFHAQPIACNYCGPRYYAEYGRRTYMLYSEILALSCRLLRTGGVIAAKGMGGYHIICDARSDKAVARLRNIKARDTKPFAVMFKDIAAMKPYVHLNEREEEALSSWRRPIVLLRTKPSASICSPLVHPGMKTLGCMLPYLPLHYDWFERLYTPVLVVTSGNLNDRPIAVHLEYAGEPLSDKVDLVLHHDRIIHNRADDSVVQICGDQTCVIRRSRGYVPEPFSAGVDTEGILAFGAEKANTFALGKGDTIIQSQYIGDLGNDETFCFYTESLEKFSRLFCFTPTHLVCDLHPDYPSSVHAETMASQQRLPLLRVQHHHAHAVACMVEHGLYCPVIAVVWDGTGLGDDGTMWGGEFLLCDRRTYTRMAHPEYVPMPGGDKAALEPWRMAVSWLHHYNLPLPEDFTKRIGEEKIRPLTVMMDKKLHSPHTSSIGRLFDAFASLTGVCDVVSRQAEAAILLEQNACDDYSCGYPIDATDGVIPFRPFFRDVLEDLERKTPVEVMAAKFHNTMAFLLVAKVKQLSAATGIRQVVLSGGCFQNRRLTEQLQHIFSGEDISLYISAQIPCNDSGISVGQIAIAAAGKHAENGKRHA
ncbi:MAG: carbamoyltransferase HypF [Bacteroidales bacterium]|jgi:hydrogenase maturation protein HypF|nr:carbamoyltransferase HypF [Bacteroidales bacterium]